MFSVVSGPGERLEDMKIITMEPKFNLDKIWISCLSLGGLIKFVLNLSKNALLPLVKEQIKL